MGNDFFGSIRPAWMCSIKHTVCSLTLRLVHQKREALVKGIANGYGIKGGAVNAHEDQIMPPLRTELMAQ